MIPNLSRRSAQRQILLGIACGKVIYKPVYALVLLFCTLCMIVLSPAFAITEFKKEHTITIVVGNLRPILSANERAVAAAILPHCERCFVSAAGNRALDNLVSEELFAKARRNGTVRVIVELQIPAGSDETREQRIREVQQRVLKELAGVTHALVRSFTAVPTLVLEASDAALQILARSNYVLRVNEDGLAAPLNNSAYSLPKLIEMTAPSRSDRS